MRTKTEIPTTTAIQMKVGGMFRPEWPERVSTTAAAQQAITDIRGRVQRVAEAAAKLAAVVEKDPRAATLHAGALARAGTQAIDGIRATQERTAGTELETLTGLERWVREQLPAPSDPVVAMQIRDAVRQAPAAARLETVRQHMEDRAVVGAVLWSPPLASGLTADQLATVRTLAEQRHLPGLAENRDIIQRAYAEARRSADTAIRMVADMAGLVEQGGEYRAAWEVELPA